MTIPMYEVVTVDFNTVEARADGMFRVYAKHGGPLILREVVLLVQDEVSVHGVVCGVMNYSRGPFYEFEFNPSEYEVAA